MGTYRELLNLVFRRVEHYQDWIRIEHFLLLRTLGLIFRRGRFHRNDFRLRLFCNDELVAHDLKIEIFLEVVDNMDYGSRITTELVRWAMTKPEPSTSISETMIWFWFYTWAHRSGYFAIFWSYLNDFGIDRSDETSEWWWWWRHHRFWSCWMPYLKVGILKRQKIKQSTLLSEKYKFWICIDFLFWVSEIQWNNSNILVNWLK